MNEQEKFQNLIDALGLSVYQFGKDLGFKRVEPIYKLLRGETKEPGSTIYGKIKKAYPKVSTDWLVTGEGDIFIKEDKDQDSVLVRKLNSLETKYDWLQEMYERVSGEKAVLLGKSGRATNSPGRIIPLRKRQFKEAIKCFAGKRKVCVLSSRAQGDELSMLA